MANEEIHIGNLLVTEHDRYGKSLPVYFRIPPSVSYRVYNLLYSDVFPFQTKEELSRWAFCLGILSLEKVERFDYSSPLLNLPLVIYGTYVPVDKYRCGKDRRGPVGPWLSHAGAPEVHSDY
jgi:hypothetical protein